MMTICWYCGKESQCMAPDNEKCLGAVREYLCEDCERIIEGEKAREKDFASLHCIEIEDETCPRCNAPLREIPGGHVCDACQWGWVLMKRREPKLATEDIDAHYEGDGIRYGCGVVRPGFDSHDPPWSRGRTKF